MDSVKTQWMDCKLDYRAEGGSLRIDSAAMAVQFGNGFGDGQFSVTVRDADGRGAGAPDGWQFVDSLTVKTTATISGADWEDCPIHTLAAGRWFVFRAENGSGNMLIQRID